MDIFFYIAAKLIAITLDAVTFAMLIRMLLPLFLDTENSRIYAFVCVISEPFIAPVRFLLAKFNLLQGSVIDWSFTITYLLIVMLRYMLPII